MERAQPGQIRTLPRQHNPARRHQIGNRHRRLQTLKLRLANPRHPSLRLNPVKDIVNPY
jgi:hypothetical protein